MKDSVIETSIDEFIQALKKKGKMGISEAADFFNASQKQIEPWLNILEENGFIEIKYPVIGEPKIVLKASAPEKIDIKKLETKPEEKPEERPEIEKEEFKPEIKEEKKKLGIIESVKEKIRPKPKVKEEVTPIKISKIREKLKIKPEIRGEDIEAVTEKVEKLESKITDLSHEVDISMIKEELFEILLIIAGLRNIEKISFYLKETLSLIHKMKEKNMWADEDKVLVITMLEGIARDWEEYGEKKIAEVFDGVKEKVESA